MPGKHSAALIVDDDDPIRSMLAKIIERLDLDVETARDGAEAIEKIDARDYKVIVLDLMMPHVDGFEVLRFMHEKRPDLLNRTIIASAVPQTEIYRRLGDDNVFRIHAKPFEMSSLLSDVGECVRSAAA
jgi:DNA-binding response OmpR family regulator